MDITSFLTTYGGPGGLAAAAVVWAIQSRKFDADRRSELREDIDREQRDNRELRAALQDRDQTIAEMRMRMLRCGGSCLQGDP